MPDLYLCDHCGDEVFAPEPDPVIEAKYGTGETLYGALRQHLKECEKTSEEFYYNIEDLEGAKIEFTFIPEGAGTEKLFNVGVVRFTPDYKLFEVKARSAAEARKKALAAGIADSEDGNEGWGEDSQRESRYETDDCEEAE